LRGYDRRGLLIVNVSRLQCCRFVGFSWEIKKSELTFRDKNLHEKAKRNQQKSDVRWDPNITQNTAF